MEWLTLIVNEPGDYTPASRSVVLYAKIIACR
jgi:hypothetical protein